ncbi:helix-turn-helix domain-containing protein [Oceanobacillus alkalisoli]|uniref:helix-turn-helix domain-containing protein n=1 Tax=Oceanobacillus alkalisoli TaxID=2925113 RepID=UPI001EF0D30B|nr:helix-turn-helix domain-containing protein [Oceanobacillus alkalisoli]MCF3942301.1 helix-turn-helix domain-containing protein [Oceanobacillus alkalisoli]MCG5105174.1 helix-turn-helix domain-containing protein [Oceanobacillus alkalisoli]
MTNKVDILMHPVRIKISQVLMRNKENGLSPREMLKSIKDVPQATLYRHIQVLLDAGIIRVLKEKKVRSVSEKYYILNAEQARLSSDDWKKASLDEKINYYSYYQLSLLNQYKTYLTNLENDNSEDGSTFSIVELNLDDDKFKDFQVELNNLMLKYYNDTSKNSEKHVPIRTIGVTIIPDS